MSRAPNRMTNMLLLTDYPERIVFSSIEKIKVYADFNLALDAFVNCPYVTFPLSSFSAKMCLLCVLRSVVPFC